MFVCIHFGNPPLPARPTAGCQGDRAEFLGVKCLSVSTAPVPWFMASASCLGDAGKLLILDEATTNGISGFLAASDHSDLELWTGLSRYSFYWINGKYLFGQGQGSGVRVRKIYNLRELK